MPLPPEPRRGFLSQPSRSSGGRAALRVSGGPRPAALSAPKSLASLYPPDPKRFPQLADLPLPGTRVPRGKPVLTVFARAKEEGSCLDLLKKSAREALRHFQPLEDASYYRTK